MVILLIMIFSLNLIHKGDKGLSIKSEDLVFFVCVADFILLNTDGNKRLGWTNLLKNSDYFIYKYM